MCGVHGRIMSPDAFRFSCYSGRWVFRYGSISLVLLAGLVPDRAGAEHRWHETEEGRCIIVEKSPLSWLFLNNNLHLVHHAHPQVPWYDLPRLYARQAAWRKRSAGYVFSGYRALADMKIRPKEPVVHPVWHHPPSE